MKNKRNIFLLLATLLLVGCANNTSEDSSSPSENSNSSAASSSETSNVSSSEASSEAGNTSESSQPSSEASSSSSEGTSNSGSSSEVLTPLNDPDVPGLSRSEVWPSAALYDVLSYTDMFNMPELTSEASFHHGLYDDELFYRVLTRVRSVDDFAEYKLILESENDFIFEAEYDYYRGITYYGEVQLLLSIKPFGQFFEVAFDFFDGEEYEPKGLVAIDNVALFNFRNREAVVSKSSDQVKWKVDPVTFTVSRGSAGYPVGNTNNQHISNPLRVYAGNILRINVENQQFYIKEMQILASSGYAQKFVDEGAFDATGLTTVVNGDWITITTNSQISALKYERQNVMYVGQVRLLSLKVTIAKK